MIKRIFFFFPSFLNSSGHENSFTKILINLSKKKKIKYFFLTPRENKKLERNFNKFFKSKNLIIKFVNIFKNSIELKKILFKSNEIKKIIYLDGYSLYDLLTLILVSKNIKFKLIIFNRHIYKKFITNKIFVIFLKILNRNCLELIILTDTEIIRNSLRKNKFLNKIFKLPIPHTFKKSLQSLKKDNDMVRLWCPGPIRPEKYGANVNNFLNNNIYNNFTFSINENYSFKKRFKDIKIKKIKDGLTRREYYKKFLENDIIILPYLSEFYEEKTSGIFVESISIGKITLVSDNTWMSSELYKFGLKKFIIKEWENFDLNKFIKDLNMIDTKKKLITMQKNYLNFHNEKNFIKILSHAI